MALMIIILAFSLFLQGALGELVCEDLPVGMCSFAIASSGKRCLLETSVSSDENMGYQCKTSEVVANNMMNEYIETDFCVKACGIDRKAVGISSDNLLESQFIKKLCSPECQNNCPNIVDLYHNLALGEGMHLPGLCKKLLTSSRREMAQILSSGVASGPVSAVEAGSVSEEAVIPSSDEMFSTSLDIADAPI